MGYGVKPNNTRRRCRYYNGLEMGFYYCIATQLFHCNPLITQLLHCSLIFELCCLKGKGAHVLVTLGSSI